MTTRNGGCLPFGSLRTQTVSRLLFHFGGDKRQGEIRLRSQANRLAKKPDIIWKSRHLSKTVLDI